MLANVLFVGLNLSERTQSGKDVEWDLMPVSTHRVRHRYCSADPLDFIQAEYPSL